MFTFHLLFTEYFIRFYWGFREKYDSAARKPTDRVINLFSNTFQCLRAHVITLRSLIKLNGISKITKETYIPVGKFDNASNLYIRYLERKRLDDLGV